MPENPFIDHTVESAPAGAGRLMTAIAEHRGYLPVAVARLANSPQLLAGFVKLNAMFEASSLDPLARETLVMTVAGRNGCELCVAMHTERLVALEADPELIAALREGRSLPEPRLEAVRVFAHALLDTTGAVSDQALAAFLAAGYTPEQALDVVLGIGTYTLSTFANRLTKSPVDAALTPFALAG